MHRVGSYEIFLQVRHKVKVSQTLYTREERTHRYGSGALLDQHLMRAIRFARWVAKGLIRELTIAELGCKGDTAILLRLCRR